MISQGKGGFIVPKVRRWPVPLVVSLAGVLMLGPALLPGYALSYDMVFVPHQSLLPNVLGLGEVLPRAVPQDAVLAVLTTLLPGQVWQHLALLFIVIGSGLGAARLLRNQPDGRVWQQCMAALLYSWSAYVAERLVLGSWPLLVSYAVLPWVMNAALEMRRGKPAAAATVVLLVGLGSLAPTGALLVLLVTIPLVATAHRVPLLRRLLVLAGLLALQAPWVIAAMTSPARADADSNGVVFALSSEGMWGPILTALGTGGVWNTDVVPTTRSVGLGLIGTVIVLVLAARGMRELPVIVGRSGALVLCVSTIFGFLVAVGQSMSPDLVGGVFSSSPALALLRDGQRWLAPLALLLALAAPLGAGRVITALRDPMARRVLAATLVALPIVVMPDAAWGVGGRLQAVQYPVEWQQMRSVVATSPVTGDVLVLPWSTFRRFEWNAGRTVLDPAPRWLTRPSVVDDSLVVGQPDGSTITVSGESSRARLVQAALHTAQPLAPVLRDIGVGLVLIEGTGEGVSAESLSGLAPEWSGGSLTLMSVPGGAQAPTPATARIMAIAGSWCVALVSLVWATVALIAMGVARQSAKWGAERVRGGTVSPQSSGGT